ncbi:MAG: hypothetical protein IPL43_14935 [Micropruina sp.]|nr:hypothetical protein [Micropruina sp.]
MSRLIVPALLIAVTVAVGVIWWTRDEAGPLPWITRAFAIAYVLATIAHVVAMVQSWGPAPAHVLLGVVLGVAVAGHLWDTPQQAMLWAVPPLAVSILWPAAWRGPDVPRR